MEADGTVTLQTILFMKGLFKALTFDRELAVTFLQL
jgi:hypothetical protein